MQNELIYVDHQVEEELDAGSDNSRDLKNIWSNLYENKKLNGELVHEGRTLWEEDESTGAYDMQDDADEKPRTSGSLNHSNPSEALVTPLEILMKTEDLRISKILRRLTQQNTPVNALDLCDKLERAVLSKTNEGYICRSIEFLLDNMLTVLKSGPIECLERASHILGLIGYIGRDDFAVYLNCIKKHYQACKRIQKYLMHALKITIRCGAKKNQLHVYAGRLIVLLKDYLEKTEDSDTFMAISATIGEFSQCYPKAFAEHFTDIVDIVVGWSLEVDQQQAMRLHNAAVLQDLGPHFSKNVEFTLGLLGQFIEDIINFNEDFLSEPLFLNKLSIEKKIGVFVGTFTVILIAFCHNVDGDLSSEIKNTIEEAKQTIMNALKLTTAAGTVTDSTILSMNEFFCSVFQVPNAGEENAGLFAELVELEMRNMSLLNAQATGSLLYLIIMVFRTFHTSIDRSMIASIFDIHNYCLNAIKLNTSNNREYTLLLNIYQDVLMLKNVPLLQEAYKHIKAHLSLCMKRLETAGKCDFALEDCTFISFYLNALSALATQSSSIISNYALTPSILELLVVQCKVADMQLWCKYPLLHTSMLSLLTVHCQNNNNFRATSQFLNAHMYADDSSSPTAENFFIILVFLESILNASKSVPTHNLCLLLNWLNQIFESCEENAAVLKDKNTFNNICKSLCSTALIVPKESAQCIETLMKYPVLHREVLEYIRDTAVCLLDSLDPAVCKTYTKIYAKLPLQATLAPYRKTTPMLQSKRHIHELQLWYRGTTHFSPLDSKYFKTFLDKLKLPPTPEDNNESLAYQYLTFMLNSNVTIQRENVEKYHKSAHHSSALLTTWAPYEAARYCVRNKLRTTIGKPQDTFLAIEGIIMQYVQALVKQETSMDVLKMLKTQESARALLGFLDYLEKHVYNAGEGTALSISAPERAAKTFFRVNAHTCNEWFKRNRTGVSLIGIHVGEPALVIRYSEHLLKTENLPVEVINRTLVAMARALLNTGEADTLQGLYVFIKTQTGSQHTWLQHAADQAAGHREKAALGYAALLDEDNTGMAKCIKEFIVDQLLDCFYYTGQWRKMRALLNDLYGLPHDALALCNMKTLAHVEIAESVFEGGIDNVNDESIARAIAELTKWPEPTAANVANYSQFHILQKIEDACIGAVMTTENQQISQSIQNAIFKSIQDRLKYESVMCNRSEHTDLLVLCHVSDLLSGDLSRKKFDINLACAQVAKQSTVLTKSLFWTLLFDKRNKNSNTATQESLYLDVVSRALNDGNNEYCRALLERFFALKGISAPLPEIAASIKSGAFELNMHDAHLLRGVTEVAKCLYMSTTEQYQLDAVNLASTFCAQISAYVAQTSQQSYPETSPSMLLTIADWLQQRGTNAQILSSPQLKQLLAELPDTAVKITDESINAMIPEAEKVVGKLLSASVYQKDDLDAAWFAFGNWCYRWGKRIVEAKNSEKDNYRGHLSPRDLGAMKQVLNGEINEPLISQLVDVLNNHQLNSIDSEDIETNQTSSTEIIEQDLRKIKAFADKPVAQINHIIQIWRDAYKNVYTYYEMATRAYFKYLTIKTAQTAEPVDNYGQGHVSDSTFVTTTLRLLRLIAKHAIGLQEVLEEGLRTTPLPPWKIIVPQLFSRLNHHEPYVRRSLSDLLCRLAKERPHLIIFPAVVGANQENKGLMLSNKNENSTDVMSTTLSTCFSSLLLTLSAQSPETVLHVKLLVRELRRVTLLWEEHWVHSLAQLYTEYSPLFSSLESECRKKNKTDVQKVKAKYAILVKFVTADLKKIAAVSEKPAETHYERNFQARYKTLIRETIGMLKKPFDIAKPLQGWAKIRQLYNFFQQRLMRPNRSILKLSDLSPKLASLQNTTISMPGIHNFDKHPIYIKSVDNVVQVLPTKTKPKKLAFFGSNGRRYTFLFKGQEDLHLDERIMQFLSISNSMMARASDAPFNPNKFKAHHYSVIPLGPQSGLISWVDGVTPLFLLYKRWQQRSALIKQQKEASEGTNVEELSTPTAARPSEIFYSKLTPLLKERKIAVSDRKQWPLSILRHVFDELCQETPKDLLSKELWCHAITPADWRNCVRNYTISMAVMSVIGYVIGLGDRHLDNMLIKLSTGEIVHIDYNICFEKGKTLRVPESVPFRLTPNLIDALGLTGVEGTFRLGCEHVLKILRKERETLLTLLEAFVYDPLVDWAINDDGTTTSPRSTSAQNAASVIATLTPTTSDATKDNSKTSVVNADTGNTGNSNISPNLELTRQSIRSRVNEIMPYWVRYKNELREKQGTINEYIKELNVILEELHHHESDRSSLSKQTAMVQELQALGTAIGSHSLNTVSQRFKAYKVNENALYVMKKGLEATQKDAMVIINKYDKRFIAPLASEEWEYRSLLKQLEEAERVFIPSEFDLVRELLAEQLFVDSNYARQDMRNTNIQMTRAVTECLNILLQYMSLMQYYPRSRLQENHLIKFEGWHRQLMNEEHTTNIKCEIENCCSDANLTEMKENARDYAEMLEKHWLEINIEMHRLINAVDEEKKTLPALGIEVASIKLFVNENPELHTKFLEISLNKHLLTRIAEFSVYEKLAFNEIEKYPDLLTKQMDFVSIAQAMSQTIFLFRDQDIYSSLLLLMSALQSLQQMQFIFESSFVDRAVKLFMQDDNIVLQSQLEMICNDTEAIKEFLLSDKPSPLLDLLLEMNVLFVNFGYQLAEVVNILPTVLEDSESSALKTIVETNLRTVNGVNAHIIYQTMADFFLTVRHQVESFNCNDCNNIYDLHRILQPITNFINYMQISAICGLPSLLIENLRRKLNGQDVPVALEINGPTMKACGALIGNLEKALEAQARLRNNERNLEIAKEWVEHYNGLTTVHYWMNERLLRDKQPPFGHIIYKDKLLSTLQNTAQPLNVWLQTMLKIWNELQSQQLCVLKLLDQTECSNQELRESFMARVQQHNTQYEFYTRLGTAVLEDVDVLMKFEMIEVNGANKVHEELATLINKWVETVRNWQTSCAALTKVEHAIVQLLDPEGCVDQCWIDNVTGLLDELTFASQKQIASVEKRLKEVRQRFSTLGQQLQLFVENPVIINVRQLVKIIKKHENQTKRPLAGDSLQQTLKAYIEKLLKVQQLLLKPQNIVAENVDVDLLSEIEACHKALLELAQCYLTKIDDINSSPTASENAATTENETLEKRVQTEQKRNAYGVSVWKRVRMKLEGRDPDSNRRNTVSEQIDWIIREATNPDNLAVLYEGWTPWV